MARQKSENEKGLIVKVPFRDKDNFDKLYEVGEEVSFDADRIEKLIKLGLVEEK